MSASEVISDQSSVSSDQWSVASESTQLITDHWSLFTVIIPNRNGAHHLPVCLDSLREQTYPRLEVILVDNASSDGSLELLARDYPEVLVVALAENRGFAGACNAGMRASRGEFVALLNNDTEVDARWAQALVDAFARHPEAGLVASKMLLFDRRDTFHTAGDYYRLDGLPGNRGVWQKDEGQFDTEEYVFSACGGSAAYRRSMLDQIGLLDEDFYFSCEDLDLAVPVHIATTDERLTFVPRLAIVLPCWRRRGSTATTVWSSSR